MKRPRALRTPSPRTAPRKAAAAVNTSPDLKKLAERISLHTRSPQFGDYLQNLLVDLCRVDTTPNPDVGAMRNAEDQCFRILEKELNAFSFPGQYLERRAINPAIDRHPNFSLLHFTKTPSRPRGLSTAQTYKGRSNLVCHIPGRNALRAGKSVAINGHIDVVAPYFPPVVKLGKVFGRGACDDKGPVVSMVGALKVISDVLGERGLELNRNVVAMFVVEEETGGNGSLSLALDRQLKDEYDSILVNECTALKLHPANRGAVWYRAELTPPSGVSPLEMFAFVNEELEKEGAAIRAESRHRLFPQRPVQTCHGIIGPFGEHPSRICGFASFRVRCRGKEWRKAADLLNDCLESGLAGYVGLYGDKTKVMDSATGKPMVGRHYDVLEVEDGWRINVHGATGHMGAIRERDGAITKMAHLVRALVASKARLEALAGGTVLFELVGGEGSRTIVLEGGQGFLPTHRIEEVMERMRFAADRGVGRCLPGRIASRCCRMTYEKLHNVAFDGDPDSESMRNALEAARLCGLPGQEPVLGWTVSCDARLFATEYPGMEVLTFGPGQLVHAHSDNEQVDLADVRAAAAFLAVFLLKQTGTIS